MTKDSKGKTYKTCVPGVVRNDTWYPVIDDNAAYENGLDINKICDYAVTFSRAAKKAIKKAYYWTGIWAATTAALAGGFGYTLDKGDHLAWLKESLAAGALGSAFELYKHVVRKKEEYRKEMERLAYETEHESMKAEYVSFMRGEFLGLMKELMESDLDINDKVNYKDVMEVHDFTSKLFKKGVEKSPMEKLHELKGDLDIIKTCMEDYIEKRSGNHGNSMPEIGNEPENDENWYRKEAVA